MARDLNLLFLPVVSRARSLSEKLHLKAVSLSLVAQICATMFLYSLALKQKPTTSYLFAPFPGFGRLPAPQPIHREISLKTITSKWYLFPRPAKQPLPERCCLIVIPLYLVTEVLGLLLFVVRSLFDPSLKCTLRSTLFYCTLHAQPQGQEDLINAQ